ncbi:MAG TPA: sugar MFS transporter, partial [Polyangia bacterium]|nr:sugar MFS transporter [Polyangia bacterium]
ACELTDNEALFVTFAFYIAYFCLALPSSAILGKTGFKKGMSLGLLIMAVGALTFIPAAVTRSFGLFLSGLFVQGMGLALLQTASNPYVSIVGPIESAARRISIMGICNKVAGALGQLILSAIVLKGAEALKNRLDAAGNAEVREQLLAELAGRVIGPYLVMAGVLVLLAVMIRLSPLPEIDTDGDDSGQGGGAATSILQFPHLLLGALCIFVYVGAEVMAGDVIGPYGQKLGLSLDITKYLTSATLTSMLVGYVLGIALIPRVISQQTALKFSAVVGLVFATIAYATSGLTSIVFIALLGLANAPMWPAIFPLGIKGLGRFTKTGSAILIMGIAGGAVIPQFWSRVLMGKLHVPAQSAFFWTTVPCYVYILFYAVVGHRARRR